MSHHDTNINIRANIHLRNALAEMAHLKQTTVSELIRRTMLSVLRKFHESGEREQLIEIRDRQYEESYDLFGFLVS